MRFLNFLAVIGIASLSGCGLADMGGGRPDGSVSRAVFVAATADPRPFKSIPMRGQNLNISLARVAGKDYAVAKFVPGMTTRLDQPDMQREVLPAVERATGCTVLEKSAFGVAYFMPRNTNIVLPLACDTALAEPEPTFIPEPTPAPEAVRELPPLRDDPNLPI